MKKIIVLFLFLVSLNLLAQRPSKTVIDKDKYMSDTEWACDGKHFGYYFSSFSMPIKTISSIENELLSGSFILGYTYRYKVLNPLDLGVELKFVNRYSRINKDFQNIFNPGLYYDKVKTFHNSVGSSFYLRYNLSKSDYRHLGIFIDFGAYYDYAFNYGIAYKLKNDNINERIRFKKLYYLSPMDYGILFRVGLNNISLFCQYSFTDWIVNFNNLDQNYSRTPLLIGVQMNLYAK